MTSTAWWTIACGLTGLLIGAAVRAAICRGAVAYPPGTNCTACDVIPRHRVQLVWPITGRCRACSVRAAPPPLVPELLNGAVFAASAWIAQTEDGTGTARALRTAGLCWLAGFALAAVWVDAVSQRLPDGLVLPAGAGSVLLFCSAAFCNSLPAAAVRTVLAAATTAAAFLLLALFADVGLGDVKLAASLGAALGYTSWSALWLGAVLTFLLAGLFVALRLLTGYARRGDGLALGPFLFAGCFVALCLR